MIMRSPALTLLVVTVVSWPVLAQSPNCAGDCDQDGIVRIDELIRLVKAVQSIPCPIAPNCPPPDPCLGLDIDDDGVISIGELTFAINRIVEAVGNALRGCQ
jgi:hypothetical protein